MGKKGTCAPGGAPRDALEASRSISARPWRQRRPARERDTPARRARRAGVPPFRAGAKRQGQVRPYTRSPRRQPRLPRGSWFVSGIERERATGREMGNASVGSAHSHRFSFSVSQQCLTATVAGPPARPGAAVGAIEAAAVAEAAAAAAAAGGTARRTTVNPAPLLGPAPPARHRRPGLAAGAAAARRRHHRSTSSPRPGPVAGRPAGRPTPAPPSPNPRPLHRAAARAPRRPSSRPPRPPSSPG